MTESSSQSSHQARTGTGVFVGRQQEMAELTAALDEALTGSGRLVMLVGEPGIGKTRTAQELAYLAEQRGAQVLWGRCFEESGVPPYWPWVQVMRAFVQQTDAEQLAAVMGPGAANIVEIVPEIRNKLPHLETPPDLDPDQARFRLFDSITTFLKNAAQRQPLILVLDDLQWADRSSLQLLEFLAREIGTNPVLVLGTYRDVEVSRRHPLSETLGSLIREQNFLRVQLPGLDEQEVDILFQQTAAASPPPGLSATIHRRTGGNPLFASEIIGMLTREGWNEDQHSISVIPEGVRDAIGRRLNRLSEGCNQVLTIASVVGREFDFRLLNLLTDDLTEEFLLGLVDEALEAHVIEQLPENGERYQFSHALIQETLSSELSTSRKVRLHARIGEALEDLYGDDAEGHAAELAHHFAESEIALGAEKLVHYGRLAGEAALAVYAWEEAEVHFQIALDAKRVPLSGPEPASDSQTAELLFGLGRAQVGTFPLYRIREAVATLNRAFRYYADEGDIDRALTVVEFPIIGIGIGRRSGRAQMIERAMKLMPPDFHGEGRLLSDYGLALGVQEGDDNGARTALMRASDIAKREGDTALEMRNLCNAARVDGHQGRTQEALEKSLRALELAERVNDPAAEADAHHQAGNYLISLGDPVAAQHHATALSAPAEKMGDRYSTLNALLINLRLSTLAGDWAAARGFSDRAVAVAPLDARLLLRQIISEYQEGDFVQGAAYLDRLLEVMKATSPGPTLDTVFLAVAITQAAWITGSCERLDVAESAALAALSSPYATHSVATSGACARAILSVLRGDSAAAAEQYTLLASDSGSVLIDSIVVVDRVLGLLAHTKGDPDRSITHFEDARSFCRKAGYWPELAWTCYDYAGCLLQTNSTGDQAKAVALLDESLAISTELGMPPLIARVQEKLGEIKSTPGPPSSYPDGLTQREVEVLCLLASGKSNGVIAGDLVLSVRTVERHISNIYAKTNCHGRANATAFAFTHGLMAST